MGGAAGRRSASDAERTMPTVIRVSPSDLGTSRPLGSGLDLGVWHDGVPCVYWEETTSRGERSFVALWPPPHSPIVLERSSDQGGKPTICVVCLDGAADE